MSIITDAYLVQSPRRYNISSFFSSIFKCCKLRNVISEPVTNNFTSTVVINRVDDIIPKHPSVTSPISRALFSYPHPRFKSELLNDSYSHFNGAVRDVYISDRYGYKVEIVPGMNDLYLTHEVSVLNRIYMNTDFYSGAYSQFSFWNITLIDDTNTPNIKVSAVVFDVIPESHQLSPNDKIPLSVLFSLYKLGYEHYDIQRKNFIKVKRGDCWDYIPIDAKRIVSSSSLVFKNVDDFILNGPYSKTCSVIDFNA